MNFNKTQEFLSRKLLHVSLVSIPKADPCAYVLQLAEEDRCQFVKDTKQCHTMVRKFDYLDFIFCTDLKILGRSLSVVGLIVFTIILLNAIRIISEKSFAPIMLTIGKYFNLSEYLTGFIVVAIGNSINEIYWAFSSFEEITDMYINTIFGCNIFELSIIGGILMLFGMFQYKVHFLIKDTIFLAINVIWMGFIMYRRQITIYEACFMVIFYIVYLLSLFFESIIVRKNYQADMENENISRNYVAMIEPFCLFYRNDGHIHVVRVGVKPKKHVRFVGVGSNDQIFFDFFMHISNFCDCEKWDELKEYHQLWKTLNAPLEIMIALIVPNVDYRETNHGWSKLLRVLNVISLTMSCFWVIGSYFEYWYIPLSLSGGVALIVFFTSRTDRPPSYYMVYAFFGYVGNTLIIYGITAEIGSILTSIGTIIGLSYETIGLLVIAWEDSLSNLVVGLQLIRQGYYKMVFAALYGSIIFSNYLQNGIRFILKAGFDGTATVYVRGGALGPTAAVFLLLLIFFVMNAFLLTRGKSRHSFGWFLAIFYLVFMLFTLLCDRDAIHPYGTDHHESIDIMD